MKRYRSFSCDVQTAMLVYQNKEMAAIIIIGGPLKPILQELNSVFMQTTAFVSVKYYDMVDGHE